eukprot:1592268-Prymnesium_polylepis.1
MPLIEPNISAGASALGAGGSCCGLAFCWTAAFRGRFCGDRFSTTAASRPSLFDSSAELESREALFGRVGVGAAALRRGAVAGLRSHGCEAAIIGLSGVRGGCTTFCMEMTHLHALFKSALVQAAHPLRLSSAALQSRWPTASR